MSNADQTLRLLTELERLDRDADDDGSPASGITPAALLTALVESNFDLMAAIVSVRSGA